MSLGGRLVGRQVDKCWPTLRSAYPWHMAILLTIDQQGLEKLSRFGSAVQKQLPFATSVALNAVAFDGRTAANSATVGAFNKPTRFTQTAFLVQKSTKRDLTAAIYANDAPGKNRAKYLRYGIQGGARPAKGFERYFAGVANDGTITPGTTLVPTRNVKLNASGNVSLATLKSIGKGLGGNPRGGFFIHPPGCRHATPWHLPPQPRAPVRLLHREGCADLHLTVQPAGHRRQGHRAPLQ